MEHINTIETRNLCESATSCGIANQACENEDNE